MFVLLNPSTADAENDDPTLRRCIGFAQAAGAGALTVLNLFAFRATKPADLWQAADPIGPETDAHIAQAVEGASMTIAGWGTHGARRPDRVHHVSTLIGPELSALAVTKDGHPRHPLYIPASARALPWGPGLR